MKRNQLWINTRVELQWNPETQQYDEVSVEGYWADADSVAYAHASPILDLDSYAFYNDGTQAGSVIIGSVNTPPTLDADTTYLVRLLIQETAGAANNNHSDILEYDLNNSGTFTPVTTTSNVVRSTVSTLLEADGTNTTQRIGAGTFIATNAGVDNADGTAGPASFAGSDETEFVFAIQIRSADVTNGDTIQLRAGGLNTYTNTASATANVPVVVSVTPIPEALTITDGSLVVQALENTDVTLVPEALTVTDGTLVIATTSSTEINLVADTLAVTDGSLAVQADVDTNVSLTSDTLAVTDGTLAVSAQTNTSVTLSPDTLTVTDGTLNVDAFFNTSVTLTPDTLTLVDGVMLVGQSLGVTLIPDSLVVTDGSVSVQANVDTNVSLTSDSLSVTDGVLTVGTVSKVNITLTPDTLTVTDGKLRIWSGPILDSIPPDSGAAYYCQGGTWHLIDPRGSSRLYIQDVQPSTDRSYMWVQTNINGTNDFSIWLNDTTLDEVFP